MANKEQLTILRQGVDVWNKWKKENPDTKVHLSWAELMGAELMGADLMGADLMGADLIGANLSEAELMGAFLHQAKLSRAHLINAKLAFVDFTRADFSRADLSGAQLIGANLTRATLIGANLSEAFLIGANLTKADLSDANLGEARFDEANLCEAHLQGSIFSGATVFNTIFAYLDLRAVTGLGDVIHTGPSTIGADTFAQSAGEISEAFLRGCGLSDWEVEEVKLYNPDLSNDEINKILYRVYDLRATQALQISPLFVSYSHTDSNFVDKIGGHFDNKGIRYWRDIHDMKSGRIERQIDRAIRQNPTVLLVLSEHSLNSDWVEHEVRTARQLEKDMVHDVLCPVALDDSWKSSRWPARIMEQIMEYNILDFSDWRDDSKFDGMFRKLIDGLELFYKG